jgi:hypothetical protein
MKSRKKYATLIQVPNDEVAALAMETVEIIQPNSRFQGYRDDIVNMEFPVLPIDDRVMKKMLTMKRKK